MAGRIILWAVLAMVALAGAASLAVQAPPKASKLEKIVRAPFSDAPAPNPSAANGELQNLYTGDVRASETASLDVPHREQKEVSDWLVKAISEIMAVDAGRYNEHMKHLATGMDAASLASFQNFMQQSNVLQTLQANNLVLHCYVETEPLLLNKGAVEGRYRWLFEMPMTLTFLSRTAKSYEGSAPINQRVIVRVQVGRVPRGQGVNQLMIESFDVRKNPAQP